MFQTIPTIVLIWLTASFMAAAADPTHSFLACGKDTYMVDGQGKKTWTYPHATRDGYVLTTGNILLAVNKSKSHPGGAVVEVHRDGTETLLWEGTQSEVNSAQPTTSDTIVLTEAGPKPRLLEIDRRGNVLVEFPLDCQLENHHMQTRMSRKLLDGSYLVPHLLDFTVRHYDKSGKVLSSLDTTSTQENGERDAKHTVHSWPFTAIRHGQNQTLVCCTHSNTVVEFDASGRIAWKLTNADLPGPWLQDPCGAQLLPNGNIVIASYAAGGKDPNAPKLIEVNRKKEVIWTYQNGEKVGIHHFQILDIDGQPLDGPVLK